MPKTRMGKLSLGLMIAMPLLFLAGSILANMVYKSVPSGNSIFEDLARRPLLALSMLAGMAVGVSAFIAAAVAVFKFSERALSVYVVILTGVLFLFFLGGEFIFPH